MEKTIKLSRSDSLRREFILKGSMARVIPSICAPLALYQGFNQLFRVVDNIMASYISSRSVSAVAYLSQITQILLAVGGGLAVGASILISRFYGAGDYKRVKELINTLYALCAVLSIFVFSLIPFARPILQFFGTPQALIDEGKGYFIISLIDIVVIFYNNIYISIERAMGNSKRILRLNSMCIVVKFALTGFFVYVLKTGIDMIALAGIIANLFILIPGLFFLLKNKALVTFAVSKESFSPYRVKPLLGLSYPVMTEKAAFAAGKIAVNSMSTGYGSLTVGALGITNNISGFVTCLQNGFQEGCSSIISQNLGAKNTTRALEAFRVTLLWNILIGTAGYILTMVFLSGIASLFSPGDREFALMIERIYRWEASGIIPLSINATAVALLYGFGYTKLTLIINFCRVLVFRVPLLWVLQHFTDLGIQSVGIVMMTSNILVSVLSGTIALVLYLRLHKAQKKDGSFIHLHVSANKKAEFSDFQEALTYVGNLPLCTEAYISLGKGTYEGQFYFDGYRQHRGMQDISLRVRGRGMKKTILSGSLCASMQMENGEKRGTFRSYTAFFGGPSVRLENLSIENTSGLPDKKGRKAGQAIALYADASCMYCKRVGLYGHQDTLFTAPLPQKEKIPGGFTGPGKDKERKPSIQIYTRCDIEGTIDFIFGGAGCFIDHSRITIRPLYPKDDEQDTPAISYIAAPGGDTPLEAGEVNPGAEQSGFVFNRCQVRKTKDCNAQSIFLARPWRPYARCTWISCDFGKIIDERLWDNWNDEENEKTVFFAENSNSGLRKTSNNRIKQGFGKKLTKIQTRQILSQFHPFV